LLSYWYTNASRHSVYLKTFMGSAVYFILYGMFQLVEQYIQERDPVNRLIPAIWPVFHMSYVVFFVFNELTWTNKKPISDHFHSTIVSPPLICSTVIIFFERLQIFVCRFNCPFFVLMHFPYVWKTIARSLRFVL
jgi:hypothetical protein